ncbi:MAG TPA: 30S ribosome-binding factor RbfA [Verrucomicrobiae bacterium]|nr:30S ribosome-binding factor RbfA [Verrucomicrobiae bacterium]
MGKHRVGRVNEAIKEEISQILREDLKDPRVGFITVTGVESAPDLSFARIFVSVMGTEEQGKESLRTLKGAAGFVRSELGKRLRLRHTPVLTFELDESIEQGVRIARLLNEVIKEPEQGERQ